jgi:hypothetical protein
MPASIAQPTQSNTGGLCGILNSVQCLRNNHFSAHVAGGFPRQQHHCEKLISHSTHVHSVAHITTIYGLFNSSVSNAKAALCEMISVRASKHSLPIVKYYSTTGVKVLIKSTRKLDKIVGMLEISKHEAVI